jgi:hypothetical protein
VLLGIAAVGEEFGLGAMGAAVFALYLIYLWQEKRRKPACFEAAPWWLGNDPALPPPGKRALPPPGKKGLPPPTTPRIGQSQRRALPGPKK